MPDHNAEKARGCTECGGPMSEARRDLGLDSCSGPCNAVRRARLADRTHGGNHAPLPDGTRLKAGFCAGCDALSTPPGSPVFRPGSPE